MSLSKWKLLSALALPGMLAATTAVSAQAPMAAPVAAPAPATVTSAPVVMDHNGGCCDNGCGRQGGAIGSLEWLYLKPTNSGGIAPLFNSVAALANGPIVAGLAGGPLGIAEPNFDLESAWRISAGWQTASGLGARITYFDFNNGASADSTLNPAIIPIPVNLNLDYHLEGRTLDLEVIDTFRPADNYLLTLSAGFRYVEYVEQNRLSVDVPGIVTLPDVLVTGFDSRDYGLVFGADLTRRVGSNLALFVGTRLAAVYGDQDKNFIINVPGGILPPGLANINLSERQNDTVKFIFEGRAGAEYTRETARGALAFVRLAAEAQYWDKFSGNPLPLLGNSEGAFGLIGFGISAGLSR